MLQWNIYYRQYTFNPKTEIKASWIDVMWCDVFNVGPATGWTFANDLGVNQKADPEKIGLPISILRHVARPSFCQGTPRGIIDRELGGHCTHDGFYMHQAPLAYMVVFSQRWASNPCPPVSSPTLYRPGWIEIILSTKHEIKFKEGCRKCTVDSDHGLQ